MGHISFWYMLLGNPLGRHINIIQKNTNTKAVLSASKKVGGGVETEEIKYMFMSHNQTTGQNHYIKKANKSFQNVAKFKYLGIMVTNKIAFIKKLRADNLRNTYYNAVQNCLSSIVLSKHVSYAQNCNITCYFMWV
jgi:hypothetical protein